MQACFWHRALAVAPFTGAWIETVAIFLPSQYTPSRPSRARGLKHVIILLPKKPGESRPSRARGLKPRDVDILLARSGSRPSRARGLKHNPPCGVGGGWCRALHGRVD